VLSDIHGVLPALDAALAEPEVMAADRVVVLGDIVSGPQPCQVLDRIGALGDHAVLVRGNGERELVALRREPNADAPDEISPWAAAQLRPDQVALIDGLPHPVTLQVEGFGDVLFCHGTPRRDDEIVLVDSPLDRWTAAFAGLADSVRTVVCGHTHMPFLRLVDRRTVVNPGSVGMPYGSAGAHWALLAGGAITLHRSRFDADEARRSIRESSTYPDVDAWTAEYLTDRYSDVEALEAFRP